MNKQRRKAIEDLIEQIEAIKTEVESILEDETQYYDNMPESFQNAEKGEITQGYIDNIQAGVDSMDEAISSLQECL